MGNGGMHRYTYIYICIDIQHIHSKIHGTVQWVSTGCLVLILTEAMGGCEETDTSTPEGYGETSHTFMVCGLNVVSNYIQRNCISITHVKMQRILGLLGIKCQLHA